MWSAFAVALLAPAAEGGWTDDPRAFLEDGPGWLLTAEERERLEGLPSERRREWIEGFLARGAAGELSAKSFAEVLDRRRELAQRAVLTPIDARYRALFLLGSPAARLPIACAGVLRPLEIWTLPAGHPAGERALAVQRSAPRALRNEKTVVEGGPKFAFKGPFRGWKGGVRVIFYQPEPDAPYRLWTPLDGKRALYERGMEAELSGWEERPGLTGLRPDLERCAAAKEVDRATGIHALRTVTIGRPKQAAVRAILDAPADRSRWARAAAEEAASPSLIGPVMAQASFQERSGTRVGVQFLVSLPADSGLVAGRDGRLVLVLDGILERDGRILDHFQLRFLTRDVEGEPVALVAETDLAPGPPVVARFRVRDEIGGGEATVSEVFFVPRVAAPERPPGGGGFLFRRRAEEPVHLERRIDGGLQGSGGLGTPASGRLWPKPLREENHP